jgi:hypothetical protein
MKAARERAQRSTCTYLIELPHTLSPTRRRSFVELGPAAVTNEHQSSSVMKSGQTIRLLARRACECGKLSCTAICSGVPHRLFVASSGTPSISIFPVISCHPGDQFPITV